MVRGLISLGLQSKFIVEFDHLILIYKIGLKTEPIYAGIIENVGKLFCLCMILDGAVYEEIVPVLADIVWLHSIKM